MGHKDTVGGVETVKKNDTDYEIHYENGKEARVHILNNHVFRYHMDPNKKFPEFPEPRKPDEVAKINSKRVSDYDKKAFEDSHVAENEEQFIIHVHKIHIAFNKVDGKMTVFDKRTSKLVLAEGKPLTYSDSKSKQVLEQQKDEQFFGGGMQNGRFTHKGKIIHIKNTNNWVDGGVTSPCPFYWSSKGYGVLRNTWQDGKYDFGSQYPDLIKTAHESKEFDAFYFINALPKDLLNDYFELTGRPLCMPEYAFYEAHLNTFNRDYWVKVTPETRGARLFEDGFYYKKYQPNQIEDKDGILESLNGENNNYQFSARAMLDRYKKHDLPLGWFLPNDGYGSGYGQTDSLDGDVENLKEFGDYARKNGVEIALWTESQLEPKDPSNPKKGERDLKKEISVAGVVALKCDVAWIGYGYSFGLNAVETAYNMFKKSTIHRPMIIMVDGWAGTQRYSGIWTGDQVGGEWEYIRFHIPTYTGSGLSGIPLIGSDMDGIYGGKSRDVNIRDFQWKAFTPLQLNMDGWGNLEKTPFIHDDEATAINRAYLKLKSMLMPYNYTIGYESTHGLPMIRAMFLEFPEEMPAYTNDSKYQFMWGPSILVAPIYQQKGVMDASVRNGVYLPDKDQVWIDFFTGEKYQGGKILNNLRMPIWKIPVFIREGSIIPMTNPNNHPSEIMRNERIFNVYPNLETSFEVYEDDGFSIDYLNGHFATTKIEVIGGASQKVGDLFVSIDKTKGSYNNIVKERNTLVQIIASEDVHSVKVAINGAAEEMSRVTTDGDFDSGDNVFYYKQDFVVNPYLNNVTGEIRNQKFLKIKVHKIDVTTSDVQIKIKGYTNNGNVFGSNTTVIESLDAPSDLTAFSKKNNATLIWEGVDQATYYEIDRNGVIFSNIFGQAFTFEDMDYETKYTFKIRSVNDEGVSNWSNSVATIEHKDPYKSTVKGVLVSCSVPCQAGQAICKLTDGNLKSVWHTKWSLPNQADPSDGKTIKLNFDLGDVYQLEKMEYHPRPDAGNGTFLKIKYRTSVDGENWTPYSEAIDWVKDDKIKTVSLGGQQIQFIQWEVLKSVSGFGAGRQILFYRSATCSAVGKKLCQNIVVGVKATCNLPTEPGYSIRKLTDCDISSLRVWHTKWDDLGAVDPDQGKFITLNFDLGYVYEIAKMQYYPRDDAGNGTFLKVQYKTSKDGNDWSSWSGEIVWEANENVKEMELRGLKFRYMELKVLDSVGKYGSGRQVLFHKKST